MGLTIEFKERRAVLVSGGISSFQNYERYLHDLHIFHAMLCGPRYKFDPKDVKVLYANGGAVRRPKPVRM